MGLFPKFYFIGDSLTQYGAHLKDKGWIAQLRDEYSYSAELVVRGFSGYNTEWIKSLFDKVLVQELTSENDIRVVTILLGTNDAALSHREQHVPLLTFKENVRNMIAAIKQALPKTQLFLITPPPMNESIWEAKEALDGIYEPGRSNLQVKMYAEAINDLGKMQGVPVINLWESFSPNQTELFSDGLHLSEEGNTLLAQKWLEGIRANCPTLLPENFPPVTTHWSLLKKS